MQGAGQVRRALAALGVLLCAAGRAHEPAAADERGGYAFDYPRMLVQQRIFGLANSIALLAAACRQGAAAAAQQGAYAAWRARQQVAIARAVTDLSAYYFGDGTADWQSLAQRMHLPLALGYAPGSPELAAACATLPQALARPRYDFAARLRLEELLARAAAAATVEAHARACRERFAADGQEVHAARIELWREINAPLAQQATAALTRDWPDDAPAPSFAAWQDELRRSLNPSGSPTDCHAFSTALNRPDSALRNVFRMPPPLRPETPK